MATKPGLRNRNTGGYKTLDLLDQLEEESKQREEREWRRQERQYQDRLRQYGQFQAEQNAEIAKGIKMVSPLEIANRAQQERVEERRRAVNTGGNVLTPEIEAEYQRRNGGGNSLSPYQAYMQAQMAQLPKATVPEETRSNRDLRLDANRQALLAGGTNNMAADWATGKQDATTPAAQMLGLSDHGVRERMYDPTYTTRLRAIEQQNEAQQAKAVQARNQYVTIRAQRQAEEAWSKYAPYRSNPDFIEKSKPDLTNENRVYYSMAHSDEAIEENGANVNAAAYATDDEKQMYYYLWHTQGKGAADEYYYNYVETAASARKALDVELRTAARVENNTFFQDVKDSFKSVGTNAISGIGIVDLAFQNIGAEVSNLFGLGDPEINYYSLAQMPGIVTDSIRSNVAKKIAASTPGMTIGKAENAVNIASFLYETGMSMADSSAMVLMNLAGVPEWLTLGGMGAAAGTRAVRDAKERGATDWQALAFGISSAVMEALFEKMSLDQILKPSDGHFFTNAAKQTFVEGSEEFFTTWGNTVMDQIVMGDKSELFDKQRQLMEQGYSQKDALKAAALEWCIGIGTDALGGLISGFGMGGAKELGTGLGVFAMDAARDLEGGLAMTDLQNMAAASQQEARLRQQYEQQQNAPQPQPLTIPSQETVSARQTDPLGYAMDKARQGETVNKSDARAILENPQSLQALRDTGALTGKVANDSEGRQKVIDAVSSLAEQRAQESSMPAAETQQTAATEAERANPYDDLLSQIWGEQAQERTAPTTAPETRAETNDPAWDRIVADLEAQRARAAEQRAQERTAAPTTTQETAQQKDKVNTPPVPRAQETASEAPTEGKLRLPEQKQRQEAPPVPRLTLRSENATLNENRQEVTNGRQAETAAPAEAERARNETAAFRRAANDAAGGADLDRVEWRAGLGRLLQTVRNSRDAGARQQRRSEAARITDQAEAGNPERLSARDLGVADGTDEKTAVRVDDKILGFQWQQTVADYAKRGIKLTAISGQMQLDKRRPDGSNVQARAYISADGKNIVVQADNPRLSWQQLLAHEELHRLIKEDSGYRKRVMDALLADKKVRPYLSQVIDRYAEAYHSVDPTATDEDIIEELLADYRAGFDMLDPLGTNRTLAKVTKAAAKDIRAVEKAAAEKAGATPAQVEANEKYSTEVNALTYFSGGGLVDHALREVIGSSMAVEYDKGAAAVYALNNGDVFVGDVRDFSKNELDKMKDIDYFHASPVCKNYSRMNTRRTDVSDNDTDITTAQATADAIRRLMPKVFTLEQVPGYKGSKAYNIIADTLTELGYVWDDTVAKASDYGGATSRERLMLRAVRDGALPALPEKVKGYSWFEATADLIDGLNTADRISPFLQERINATPELQRALANQMEPILILGGTPGGKAWWASANEPSPSITTDMTDSRIIMPDGTIKKPDARFYARIMGLPDSYQFTQYRGKDNQTQGQKVIGNGVPVQLTQKFFGNLLDDALNTGVKYSTEIATQDVQEMEEIPDTFIDSAIGERVKYSYDIQAEQDFEPLRDEDGNIKYVYKAFYVMKDEDGIGRLYPPMISNVSDEEKKKVKGAVSGTQRNIYTPVGIVLTADVGMLARYKKDTVDEDGTLHKAGELVRNTLGRLAVTNDKGSGTLAFRPGWHLGEWPDAKQFNKDSKIYGKRAAMPDQLVFAKCEIAGSVDYQLEAMRHGVKKNGKYDRTQAGLPRVPVNGYYKYRTNPDPDTAPWYITGQMRVVEILTDEQCREICAQYGVEMSPRESGHDIDLEEYGLKAGPVDRETNTDRFLKSEKSKANERELETALSDPEYSEAYVPRDIDFDDPEILKEFERNRQDSEYYRGQYQQKYGGSASIEIDPEVAAQFSPEALALREETRGRKRNPLRERRVSRVRTNTYENSGLFDEVEAQMDEADPSNYEYDPISEKRSMNEARKRLKDFDGEVAKLSQPDYDWGGSDLDTAMGILHRYRTEGRATGDYTDFWNWSKVIQEKGTKGGQFIQAFAKYTRTGTGTAAKAAAKIHEQNQLNPAQRKQVQGHVERLLNGMPEAAQGAAGDAMQQAKGQKERNRKQTGKVDKKRLEAETRRRKDAERLIREIYRLFEQANRPNHGAPVENWLNLTGEQLAKRIASRFDEPTNPQRTIMQTILGDLMGFAREHALPERQRAEGGRTAIDTITDYLNNRDAYGAAWAQAQSVLRAQYANDPEKLEALEGFLGATIAYNAEGTDRTMLDAILQSADVLGISEKRILELTSVGEMENTIRRIGDELVSQVQERMGADWQAEFGQPLRDAVRRHINGIALAEGGAKQALRLRGLETEAARQLDIDLQKILTESRLTRQDAARRVADYLIDKLGIPSSDAAVAAQHIADAFMDELAARADRRLQQMFGEKTPKAKEQRDKLLDLIRLGGLTNANVEDAVVDALGIGKLSREEQKRITGDMARFGETLDAIMDDDLEGLRQLIREQAAVRGTKLSRLSEKVLSGETDVEYLRDFAMAQLASIAGDYAPRSTGEKISTYQTISHLLNMRTALRNVTSNQVFDLIDSAANNVSLIPDMALGLMTGKRTVGLNKSWASQQKRQGAVKGAGRNLLEVNLDVGVDDRQKSKYGTAGRRTWNLANSGTAGKIMSHLEEVMGYELNTTDEFHKGSVMGETLDSLARFVDRGDMTLEEAQDFATEMALYRSFQDDSMIGTMLSAIKEALNIAGVGEQNGKKVKGKKVHDFGLGDFLTKYTQVPGALVHRAIEFSPLGYAKAIYNLGQLANQNRKGENTNAAQRKAALAIGRATTGSGLIALFAALAAKGLLRRDDKEDKNAKAAHQAQGLSGTQLNLTALGRWIGGESTEPQDGDILMDINFLEPLDALMALGTMVAESDDLSLNSIKDMSVNAIWESISSLSMMQTLRDVAQVRQYYNEDDKEQRPLPNQIAWEIAASSVSGFIPSVVRQLAQATDTTYREQYGSKKVNEQILAKVKNSIPGLRQKLAPKITPLGEDKTYQKPVLNYLNATLNPGNISVYQASGVVDELNRVYSETEDADIWPERNAPYSFKANKETWTLTPDERTQYQRTRGQTTATFINDLMAADWYKKASASDQAKWLNWIGNFSSYVAKKEMLGARGVKYASDSYEKYFTAWTAGASPADIVRESDAKSIALTEAGFSQEMKDEVKDLNRQDFRTYLQGANLTDEEKLTALGAIIGTDMLTKDGKPSQWANVNTAVEDGNSVDTVLGWVQDGLLDDYLKYRNGDVKKAKINVDTYMTYRVDTGKMDAKDETGKTVSGLKKQRVVSYIDSLDLTAAQKDALYLDAGYSESGLADTPWHKSSGGGKGSGSYAPARIPTLKLPTVESAPKRNTGSGLKIRGTQTTSAAPRSGLRLRAK